MLRSTERLFAAVILPVIWLIPSGIFEAPAAEALVAKLGHRDYREREKAQRTLEDLGTSALPALRKGRLSDDPEIAQRASRAVQVIEYREAWRPSVLSYRAQSKTALEIAKDLAKLSGNDLTFLNGGGLAPEKSMQIDISGKTYWEALQQVCQEGGLAIFPGNQRNSQVGLLSRKDLQHFVALDGSGIASIESGPRIGHVLGNKTISYHMPFSAQFERRVRATGYRNAVVNFEAVTDTGEKLDEHTAFSEIAGNPSHHELRSLSSELKGVSTVLRVKVPTKPAEKIARLTVRVMVYSVLATTEAEFDDLERGGTKELEGLKIEVARLNRQTTRQGEIQVQVSGASPFHSDRPDIQVLDDKGEAIWYFVPNWAYEQKGFASSYRLQLHSDGGPPRKLIVRYATRMSAKEYRFTFENLPLPR